MLSRFIIASLFLGSLQFASGAVDRDYLQRGEEQLSSKYQIIYDRAVRDVLSRAWRPDVVVRMVHRPPFEPESAAGIARATHGYLAFEVTVSKHIWDALDFDKKQGKGDYRSIRPVLHKRPLPEPIAARIAALWRHVLTNERNYAVDSGVYLDSSHISYYVGFSPRERLSGYTTGWGPQSKQLINVAGAIVSYANGAAETELLKAIKRAERKLGI